MENIFLKSPDHHEICIYIWKSQKPKGIIHIFHGMREYALRYESFAEFLVENNYHVVIHEHRGHGDSMLNDRSGFLAKEGGWNKTVYDIKIINDYITGEFPNLDIYFIGHSMGSFILRDAIYSLKDEIKVNKAVIIGTGNPNKYLIDITYFLTRVLLKFNSANKPSKLLEWINFFGFHKRFKDEEFGSWLTRDTEKLKEFKNYEYSFKHMPLIFYRDLYYGIRRIIRDEYFEVDIPLLIISGSDDPLGNYLKDVTKVIEKYSKHTVVSNSLYEGFRHEVLNEVGRKDVYKYIIDWISYKR